MNPSGQRNNEPSTSGMPSISTSSYSTFSTSEYEDFRGQVTHQVMVLQRNYEELSNSFQLMTNAIQEQLRPLANLQRIVENLTDGVDQNRQVRAFAGSSGVNFITGENATEQQMESVGIFPQTPIVKTPNYDGKIIWKIQDFFRRRDNAKRGGALSIYSQPFFTSKNGYKMCLRVYLNGDGMGRNTHISLYFVLMKGEYDALLSFPFKQKVKLVLLDQGPQRRHITDTFRPDPASISFKRPTSDMNISSGCPMFVAHDALINAQYIVDDTIFIAAVVDTNDLENL